MDIKTSDHWNEKPVKAGQELADRIARALQAGGHESGSLIGSEQAMREEYGASSAVFRQAMRLLEHRGVIRLRRGQGGGILFVGQEDEAIPRDLARLIESKTVDPEDVLSLLRAADQQLFFREAPKIGLDDCIRLRKIMASLEAMSQDDFARELGHRKLLSAIHSILRNDIVLLAQRVVFEAGIDLFPYQWQVAGELSRRDYWILSLEIAEGLIANDVAAMVSARTRMIDMLKGAFLAAKRNAGREQRRLFRPGAPDQDLPEKNGGTFSNRADFLVREILGVIRARQWREGERLGTTQELLDRFNVSLPLLRQALRVLEESGAVRISRGRGGGLEIGAPWQSPTFGRAIAFLKRSNATPADNQEMLVNLLLVAIEESPMRPGAEEFAALRAAVTQAGPAFDIRHAATHVLSRAIADLSCNVALTTFVKLILDATDIEPGDLAWAPSAPLARLVEAVEQGDSGLARRALLQYVHQAEGG